MQPEPVATPAHPELVEGWERSNHKVAFSAYLIRCSDGSYYAGHTDNLEARLAAHQRGEISGYTASRRPVALVFSEQFPSRQEAFERERQIKGWSRAKKEALIEGDWAQLVAITREQGNCPHPATGSG